MNAENWAMIPLAGYETSNKTRNTSNSRLLRPLKTQRFFVRAGGGWRSRRDSNPRYPLTGMPL